jgi:hypothetical protein
LSESPGAPLQEWHDFYLLIATASTTLIGAMFVVVSIATSYLTAKSAARSRIFLTPIVLHLSTVVLGCAIAIVPNLGATSFGVLIGLGSLAGLAYSLAIAARVGWAGLDVDDRLFYAAIPVLAYLVLFAAAILALQQLSWSFDIFALALALLLVTGIRNAWDLTLFFAVKSGEPD